MKTPYTVLLLYPDWVAGNYGETGCYHTHGETPREAVASAQRDAMNALPEPDAPDNNPEDFDLVAVFAGHHQDLS
jgi:hypothetical protein